MSEEYDDRIKFLNEQEKKKLESITNPVIKDTCLDLGEFLHKYKNKKQYISINDFKKYIPLYSKNKGKELVDKHGEKAYELLGREFWEKYNPYKEIIVVDNYRNKKVQATLPASAIASPDIKLTEDQERQFALDAAKRKMYLTDRRPDVGGQGYKEYSDLLTQAIKSDDSVRFFAFERVKTNKMMEELESKRTEFIENLTTKVKSGKHTKVSNDDSLDIDEDDEIYD